MKSPNVLAWHFPSPHASRQQRVRQAGNVWLKIADYGISQVSTGLTIRVGNNPVGTPGFMAPELFEHPGQEVSAEKVRTVSIVLHVIIACGLVGCIPCGHTVSSLTVCAMKVITYYVTACAYIMYCVYTHNFKTVKVATTVYALKKTFTQSSQTS